MRALFLLFPAVLLAQTSPPKAPPASPAKSAPASQSSPAGLTTDEQKTIYAAGLVMARQLGELDLSPA